VWHVITVFDKAMNCSHMDHYQGYGWCTSCGAEYITYVTRVSTIYHTPVPFPSFSFSSATSVPPVCRWSVCLCAHADTGIHRGIQSDRHQDKWTCWSHNVVQLMMIALWPCCNVIMYLVHEMLSFSLCWRSTVSLNCLNFFLFWINLHFARGLVMVRHMVVCQVVSNLADKVNVSFSVTLRTIADFRNSGLSA